MKRKGIVITVCIIVVIIIAIAIYVSTGTKRAGDMIWEYLEIKGYTQAEIQGIDVSHSFLNIALSYDEWTIAVVYKDEPTSIYYYHLRDGNIVQGGVSGSTEKENLKH